MVTTRSRPRDREHARSSTGATAEHAAKIYGVAIIAVVVIFAFLALTSAGHTVDAATQQFMLSYAGVFALIALCASVGLGLVATDRMIMSPGHRIFVQAAHRAVSFGAVAFLIIHITTEILAQRVHALDAVVPFLSPFRTFYIGLGTIASDLIVLLVITGIMRTRFSANGDAWRWRAIHYSAYAAFIFGVVHGLRGGRPASSAVNWAYGVVVALVLLGLTVRILTSRLRPRRSIGAPPVALADGAHRASRRSAAMHAQPAGGRAARTGPRAAATDGRPPLTSTGGTPVLAALPADSVPDAPGRPYYEPGYEGPARYLGAPAPTGPIPYAGSGPMPRAASGPIPRTPTGPLPRRATGSLPRAATGPLPPSPTGAFPRAATGSFPRPATGPLPRSATGPMDVGGGPVGGGPRPPTGPLPRSATGSFARPATGPMPRPATGPLDFGAERPGGPGERGRVGQPDSYGYAAQPESGWQDPAWRDPAWPDPAWTDPAGQEAEWQEADWQYREPSGGWYPGEQHWDGVPGSDPNRGYQNQDPGMPGMPGYGGSRDHPYGGDA